MRNEDISRTTKIKHVGALATHNMVTRGVMIEPIKWTHAARSRNSGQVPGV